ncbi:MAG: hypothetical protein WD872_09630 [Pirellulaceae bacterium]
MLTPTQAGERLRQQAEFSWCEVIDLATAIGLPAPQRRSLRPTRRPTGDVYTQAEVRAALAKAAAAQLSPLAK